MQARILSQSEEPRWSQFVAAHPFSNIHQTPDWGHFQAKVPSRGKYWIVVVEESVPGHSAKSLRVQTSSPAIIAGALIVRHALPKGYCWLYAPRGPLLNYENTQEAQEQMKALTEALKELAKQEKAIFWRIDPALPQQTSLHFPHFRLIDHGFQPNDTLLLDLEKGEPQLLAEMKPKGRYNIKLAEKKGVKVHIADPNSPNFQNDIDAFYEVLQETTLRDGFSGHPKKYYEDMLTSLSPAQSGLLSESKPNSKQKFQANTGFSQPHAQLYLATWNESGENQVIAGLLATTYNGTTIYYYGASGAAHRNLMAPYLLQWQAIRDAKALHCHTYDFLGISPPQSTDAASGGGPSAHPWAGVTDFKKKFGGQEVAYHPPQEFVFKRALYYLYRLYKMW